MLYKEGSTGAEVKQIQAKVGVTADGIYGAGTTAAVRNWQASHNLPVDGEVGPNTFAAMFPASSTTPASSGPLPLAKLSGIIPSSVVSQIPETAAKFNISNTLRLAHFLAQCAHESANWTATVENLNYSEAALNAVFPSYFPNGLAAQYARQPQKIGSRVYANRMGNGDEASGEGYKYRGRGFIQLTGKNNYSAFSGFIGQDYVANPDGVATNAPLASAAFFFNSNGLWSICDQGASVSTVTAVTRRVNGGTNGLDDRIAKFNTIWQALNS